jgi:aspartate kinase
MGIIVQKYGGTSVADIDRIHNVAKRAAKTFDDGNDVVVVISAMAGATDGLIKLAGQITDSPERREMDVLLATGEQTTAALLAITLIKMGYKAHSLLGYQADVHTSCEYGNARIIDVGSRRIKDLVKKRNIVVIAGFQGTSTNGDITTLGRGGSDTTAVAVAAALSADMCEIYTDVDGIYTADPNICSAAKKLAFISYDEMLEMSSLGAKVLQIRSVEFAKKYNVAVHVRSSFNEKEGTMLVDEYCGMESVLVSGVTCNKDEARITLKKVADQPGIAAQIFTPIADAGIQVDMIIQNTRSSGMTDVTFTVPKSNFNEAVQLSRKIAEKIDAEEVLTAENIAKVSVTGVGMKNHSGVAAKMFSALAAENINIRLISTSEIRISCVVEEKYAELAVRILHTAFGLDKTATDAAENQS